MSGASIPAELKRIELTVEVAGQEYTRSFSPAPSLIHTFTWDGKDVYGRQTQGQHAARVQITNVYQAVYYPPAAFSTLRAFGVASFGPGIRLGVSRFAAEVSLNRPRQASLGTFVPQDANLGGWSVSAHHAYDPLARVLYTGDGGRLSASAQNSVISTVAGGSGLLGDGGLATQARLSVPNGIAVGPDGSLYIGEPLRFRIRRVGPDGIISTVAGTDSGGVSGDGGPATQATLNYPFAIAVEPDGGLYIADTFNHRIRRVGTDGIISTVAGKGALGFSGDGGPATLAIFNNPIGIAVGPDGNLYVADSNNGRIRKVSPPFSGFSALESVVASASGVELYRFDPSGRHLSTIDTLTGATLYTFDYDTSGHLIRITDRDGDITRIERDASGNPLAIVSTDNQRTDFTLDPNGHLASVSSPAGDTHRLQYTAEGLLIRYTDPGNQSNQYVYDALGRLVQDIDPLGGGWTLARTQDLRGHTNTLTSGEGRGTAYAVESLTTGDRRHTNTYPDGTLRTTLYKTNGEETRTAPDGTLLTVLQTPDPRFGMQSPLPGAVTVQTPSSLTSTTTTTRSATLANPNDALSLTALTQTVTRNGKMYRSEYTASSKTAVSTSPLGRQVTTVTDTVGRPVSRQVSGLAALSYGYDSRGRLQTATAGSGPAARTTTFAYGSDGYLQSVTDPENRVTSYTPDAVGRVLSQALPGSRVIDVSYDASDNVTSVRPPGRDLHLFNYTATDLQEEYSPPDPSTGGQAPGSSTGYTYNLDKQLELITLPDGQRVDFVYGAAGKKLSSIVIPTGTYAYGYDSTTGQLNSLSAPGNQTLSYAYDGFLLKQEQATGSVPGSVSFTYDSDFRLETLSVNGADAITLTYDNDSLLTAAGAITLTRHSQHGLVAATTLGSVTTSHGYNTFAELSSASASFSGNPLYSASYPTRDKLGRIVERSETIQGVTHNYVYGYDAAGRLDTVTKDGSLVSDYVYDANGNRLSAVSAPAGLQSCAPTGSATGAYDAQDRLTSYGDCTFSYTTNGALTEKRHTRGSGNPDDVTSYQYDVLGDLRSVILSASEGSQVIEYVIDAQNRRVGKVVNGALLQGFLYQYQLEPIAELDGAGNVVSRFVYASKVHIPDYMVKSGITYRIVSDHLGSPRLVVNSTDGSIAQKLAYDEFGNVTTDTNPGFQPFGFAGGIYDRHTKLTRFGARDYDAETGRWTAKDPSKFRGGTNLYAYARGNPVSYIDPNGLDVTITIDRTTYTPASIGGTINVTSTVTTQSMSGHTLENRSPPNANLPVPPGTYPAHVRTDHNPDRIELSGVPNATNVQIHNGNFPSQVIGCFLAGLTTAPDFVGSSVAAMNQINNIVSADGTGNITVIVTGGALGP